MPWKRIDDLTEDERRAFDSAFKRKARFLVDESLAGLEESLGELGYNAKGAEEAGLVGHDDTDVFAVAWREQRILVTKDRDFLNDRRFPSHRNPGVIVLPDVHPEGDAFALAVVDVLVNFGSYGPILRHLKIDVHQNREMTILFPRSGRHRLRLTRSGAFSWEND